LQGGIIGKKRIFATADNRVLATFMIFFCKDLMNFLHCTAAAPQAEKAATAAYVHTIVPYFLTFRLGGMEAF